MLLTSASPATGLVSALQPAMALTSAVSPAMALTPALPSAVAARRATSAKGRGCRSKFERRFKSRFEISIECRFDSKCKLKGLGNMCRGIEERCEVAKGGRETGSLQRESVHAFARGGGGEAGGGGGGGGVEGGVADVEALKKELRRSLEGLNRGVFGVPQAQKEAVEGLIIQLEECNPLQRPTEHLDDVAGEWRLLYSTISILGSRRTKLGLRDFITLGDFRQIIDVQQAKASNVVEFSVTGLGLLSGNLTIDAKYSVASPTRVDIEFLSSSIVPEQLMALFQKNYDLLLSIFNPQGWLEITYVDDNMRIGRDDKGHVFVTERITGS